MGKQRFTRLIRNSQNFLMKIRKTFVTLRCKILFYEVIFHAKFAIYSFYNS